MADRKSKHQEVSAQEMLKVQQEYDELRRQHNIPDEPVHEGRISRLISSFFERRENRQKILVGKKTYILLALFLGIIGAHRFYAHHWVVGVAYLATCWFGLSVAMSLIDILAVIPMEADENGKILL